MDFFSHLVIIILFLAAALMFLPTAPISANAVSIGLNDTDTAVRFSLLHRTGYHFQPTKHWMNDPNGPMYYKGYYHLFYQSSPKAAFWETDIIWGHSVSKDLVNWIPLKTAIFPSKPFDIYGCWSGAATILPGNRPILVYTGIVDKNDSQVQNYAIPGNYSDPYLLEWIKPDDNPILGFDMDGGINKTAFRDPTTAWLGLDKVWRIATGGRRKDIGVAWLFKSRDFKNWVKAKHPLHSVSGTGNWEMPDFFPVPIDGAYGLDNSMTGPTVKYVLKVSLDLTRYDYYTVGTWSYETDKYIPDPSMVDGWTGLRIDYGNFYASKSFFDPVKNRRILWGWANESDLLSDDINKGWAGVQYIPRTIWLDPNGKQILQWPIEEIATLRGEHTRLHDQQLSKGAWLQVSGITASQTDVEVVFSFPSLEKAETFESRWENLTGEDVCALKGGLSEGGLGPFGLATLASNLSGEFNPVSFTIFKDGRCNGGGGYKVLMCSDGRRSSMRAKGLYRPSFGGWVDADISEMKISLRCLIDNSVVESFGAGGKMVISSRVYPVHAIYERAELYTFNNGTEVVTVETLDAWNMKNAVMN